MCKDPVVLMPFWPLKSPVQSLLSVRETHAQLKVCLCPPTTLEYIVMQIRKVKDWRSKRMIFQCFPVCSFLRFAKFLTAKGLFILDQQESFSGRVLQDL